MKIRNVIPRSAVLLVSFAIISCTRDRPQETVEARIKNQMLLENAGQALVNKILLTEIREGRISNAIESLEFSIDCSVVVLGQQTNDNPRVEEQILRTLRMLKEYRQKFPREIQSLAMTNGSQEAVKESAQNALIIKQAMEILDAVN